MGVKVIRIYQLDGIVNARLELKGGFFEVEVPAGPVAGGYINKRLSYEQFAELLGAAAYQELTLGEAQALPVADPPAVGANTLYGITGDWNATGTDSTVYVHGVTPTAYHRLGVVYDANNVAQLLEVDVAAGTYKKLSGGDELLLKNNRWTGTNTYEQGLLLSALGGAPDLGLRRSAAGVLEINTGVAGSPATVSAMDFVAQAAPAAYNSFTKLVNKMIAAEAGKADLVGGRLKEGQEPPATGGITYRSGAGYALDGAVDFGLQYFDAFDKDKRVNPLTGVVEDVPGWNTYYANDIAPNTRLRCKVAISQAAYFAGVSGKFAGPWAPGGAAAKLSTTPSAASSYSLVVSLIPQDQANGLQILPFYADEVLTQRVTALENTGGAGAAGGRFRGPWTANAAYKKYDEVLQNSILYYANADFTSVASFNGANWTVLVSNPQQSPVMVSSTAGWVGYPNIDAALAVSAGQTLVINGRPPAATLRVTVNNARWPQAIYAQGATIQVVGVNLQLGVGITLSGVTIGTDGTGTVEIIGDGTTSTQAMQLINSRITAPVTLNNNALRLHTNSVLANVFANGAGTVYLYDSSSVTTYEASVTVVAPSGGGGAATYDSATYQVGAAGGAQSITPTQVPGLAQATKIEKVGVVGIDAGGDPVLDLLPGTTYSFDASTHTLTVLASAGLDANDVLEIAWLTAGGVGGGSGAGLITSLGPGFEAPGGQLNYALDTTTFEGSTGSAQNGLGGYTPPNTGAYRFAPISSVAVDKGGCWDSSKNVYRAKVAGEYLVNVSYQPGYPSDASIGNDFYAGPAVGTPAATPKGLWKQVSRSTRGGINITVFLHLNVGEELGMAERQLGSGDSNNTTGYEGTFPAILGLTISLRKPDRI